MGAGICVHARGDWDSASERLGSGGAISTVGTDLARNPDNNAASCTAAVRDRHDYPTPTIARPRLRSHPNAAPDLSSSTLVDVRLLPPLQTYSAVHLVVKARVSGGAACLRARRRARDGLRTAGLGES